MAEETTPKGTVIQKLIQDELSKSYLDYSMSVIVSRALPDVRDGLKPVHRRILYAMWDAGLKSNAKFKKSANVVGDVLGKYHPHGDSAVYDAMVRMAQEFSLRNPLVWGQGNFGSVDGDAPAAYRYCVTGDTLVLSDRGLIPIQEISSKSEGSINLKILSVNGKINKASKFFNSGLHRTIKVVSKSGLSVEGSYNHPVMVWSKGSNFKPQVSWKLLSQVVPSDTVLINRAHSLFTNTAFDLVPFVPKTGFKNDVQLPTKMNNDLAFILGAFVSEASFQKNRILFVNKDMEFYNAVKERILRQFKGIQMYERPIKGGCMELNIYEQKVTMFLKNIGFTTELSHGKSVPFSILRSKKEHIQSFLRALFEGDGSVSFVVDKRHGGKSVHIAYDSKSAVLINQLKVVLLNFGIISRTATPDKRSSCLRLCLTSHENISAFCREIGFFSKRKNDSLKKIVSVNNNRMSKTDFVPFLSDYIRTKYCGVSFIEKYNFDRYAALQRHFSVLSKFLDKEDKKLIRWLLDNKYFFDEIVSVEPSQELKYVYSVKVDSKCHSFVANGFVNHNTEAKLKKLAEELLIDIEKDTVDFRENYDGSLKEPVVLPAKFPNLLVNGSSGIAVGMATNIPPHNLGEICDALILMIDTPECSDADLLSVVKGPDFPTGGLIIGSKGLQQALLTGRGKVKIRSKAEIDGKRIIVTEIPYQVNKTSLIEGIVELVRSKTIEGIKDIRDESDRRGMSLVIVLKESANPEVVLNQLYKHSQLQTSFGVNMLALNKQRPELMPLRRALDLYLDHRREVVTRRTQFDLDKAEKRLHILEGLLVALQNIDAIIEFLKKSSDGAVAKIGLCEKYSLSDVQAQAILDMRLQRLTGLEQEKIRSEHEELTKMVAEFKAILASPQRIMQIIRDELFEMKNAYGDPRRTEIIEDDEDYDDADVLSFIQKEDIVITVTNSGYMKQVPLETYRAQRRGGRGIIGATTRDEEDVVEHLFITSNHHTLLVFTSQGRVHWLPAYQVPEASRYGKGKNIVNLLALSEGESVSTILPVDGFSDQVFLLFVTKHGTIKKTRLSAYGNPRKGGINAINLKGDDELVQVRLTPGGLEMLMASRNGMAVRFNDADVNEMGRTATGVRGMRLGSDDAVVGIEVALPTGSLLSVTENGFGKRTPCDEYRLTKRGGKGVINIQTSERNGKVVGIKTVKDDDEIILMSEKGVILRTAARDVSVVGRNTQGVRLMRLSDDDRVVTLARVMSSNGNGKEEKTDDSEESAEGQSE